MIVPGIPFVQGRNSYVDKDGRHYGIAIHNTSNTTSAVGEASYAAHRTDGVSAHFYVDGVEVIQSLDTRAKAGHAGSSEGNENAIAVEIVGMNGNNRDWWLTNVAWGQLGHVLAAVIRSDLPYFLVRRASVPEMQANPKIPAFYAHDDMRLAWGSTDHDDPGPNFPWDRLFDAVNAALTGSPITNLQEDGMHCVATPDGSIWYFPGTVDELGKPYICSPPNNPTMQQYTNAMPVVQSKVNLDLSQFHRFTWGEPIPAPGGGQGEQGGDVPPHTHEQPGTTGPVASPTQPAA